MSPAAVEVRPPVTELQNPNIKPQSQFDSSFSFPVFSSSVSMGVQQSANASNCNNSKEMGSISATDSQRVARSRPRLTKMRKRVASQHARSKVGSSEVGSSFRNCDCSNSEFFFSGSASQFEADFVFGANRSDPVVNLNSVEINFTDNVQEKLGTRKLESVTFGFGAEQSYRASSSEYKCELSNPSCGTFDADDGVKVKVEPGPQCERFDSTSFHFNCNLANLDSNLKCDSEKGNYNGHAEKLNSSGSRTNMESETITVMDNNEESVSVADTSNLAFMRKSKEGELNKTAGKPGTDGCSNLKTGDRDHFNKSDDLNFVFGDSWFGAATETPVSDVGIEVKAENTVESQKVEAFDVKSSCEEGRILKEDLGRDIFIFGCSSLDEQMEGRGPNDRMLNYKNLRDASINLTVHDLECNIDMTKFSTESKIYKSVLRPETVFTLPDEMKSLNINDSGNTDGYRKPECSTNNFAETSTSSGDCEKPSGSSCEGLGNTNYFSEGLACAADRTIEDTLESFGKSKTELQSDCNFSSAFVGCSSFESVNFPSECSVSCNGCQFPQPHVNDGVQLNNDSTSSFLSASLQFQTKESPFEVEKNDNLGSSNDLGTSTEFKIPQWDPSSFKENLFSDLNQNLESSVKRKLNKTKRSRKMKGNLRQTSRQDKASNEDQSSQVNLDSPGCCTPMDFSPYQETVYIDQHLKEMPSASSDQVSSSPHWIPNSTACTKEMDGSFLTRSKGEDEHNRTWNSNELNNESFEHHRDGFSVHRCLFEGVDSRNRTVFSSSKTEQCCSSGFTGLASTEPRAGFNLTKDTSERNCRKQAGSDDTRGGNFTFSASSAIQASVSATKRQHRKKNRMKSNCDPFVISPNLDIKFGSSFEFAPFASTSSPSEETSKLEAEDKLKPVHSLSTAIQEACEKWRLRGNQAYKDGDLSKAEDLYTRGINSVPSNGSLEACLNSLMLCYSNRAATRMSLGNIRKALGDCKVASELDPSFIKVKVRAANCHLLLGEIEDASQYFNKFLESRDGICLDRRMIIQAADGLQKAQKVAEFTKGSSELLEQKTDDAVLSALNLITEAISISLYSEKLLEMKAEALFMLQRYEEAIELCEHSLYSAEKNCIAENATVKTDVSGHQCHSLVRLWRWCLMAKAFFYHGKLEAALDTVGKLEKEIFSEEMSKIKSVESSFTLAATIRELLRCKNAGNEAFRSGKYTEAVEQYTVALSMNVQCRSFTAVCLCNRAAAYQALGQIADAIADCSLAIAIDETYPKAFSRRANLHEMIRDYGQAASNLQKFIFIVENQSNDKARQSSTPSRSTDSVELKKARRNMPLMEEAAKKGISLDFYLILGVKATDTASDIKKAYRKAALRHHPDKAGQFLARSDMGSDGRLWKEISQAVYKDADRLFKIIGEAYAVLSDPNKRSEYDLEEEMKKASKERNRSSNNRKSSNVYSSPFERSAYGRNFQENRNSWGNSHSRW